MIKENQIILKELTIKDYSKKYLKWMNDKDIQKFTEQRHIKHSKKSIIQFIKNKKKSKNEFLYGIFLKTNKNDIKANHLGNIKLGPIDFYNKNTFISYFIGEKKLMGKNIMTCAINKVLKISKYKFGLKKVYASFIKNNIGSMKVLKKNKFYKEAEFKKHIVFQNKRVNNVYYSRFI